MPPNQTAVCTAWGCHFGSGEASWACDTVVCECPGGCASEGQDYRETFKNVKGEVTLDCDQKSDKCLLNVSGWRQRICLLKWQQGSVLCSRCLAGCSAAAWPDQASHSMHLLNTHNAHNLTPPGWLPRH